MRQDYLCLPEYNFPFSLDSYAQAIPGRVSESRFSYFLEYFADTFWIAISSNPSVTPGSSLSARI